MSTYYSHGKLLLTGEYVVLDGALSLALPTKKGQTLTVENIEEPKLIWKSIDADGAIWFEDEFILKNNEILHSDQNDNLVSKTLLKILKAAKQLNPDFLSDRKGHEVSTYLEFPRDWGLGSSSTLINNIANWAHVDSYKLLELTFGGSGYDIACAQHSLAITYQLVNNKHVIKAIPFNPKFSEQLYFVHLNKKQNSREGIANYQSKKDNLNSTISKITAITKLICNCDALVTFEGLLNKHEDIISKLIDTSTIKEQFFKDYQGAIKSLGAWGGDFVLVTAQDDPSDYFKSKGYETIIPYKNMILK